MAIFAQIVCASKRQAQGKRMNSVFSGRAATNIKASGTRHRVALLLPFPALRATLFRKREREKTGIHRKTNSGLKPRPQERREG
ncbi:MAG: hypothetical protein LBF51_06625 [Zoogloeaceae bacterium]|jgi:hypothetical protein|nr:hypothetical protein [Zoogloeaceae bacterium]